MVARPAVRMNAPRRASACGTSLPAWLKRGLDPRTWVRTTVYVVATERASPGEVWRELLGSELGAALRTPATLVGAERLGYEVQLVEIECTAAVSPA